MAASDYRRRTGFVAPSHSAVAIRARIPGPFGSHQFTGFLAGFANTNLRAADSRMVLRIWAVGIGLLSDHVNIYVSTDSGLQGPVASFDLVRTTDCISVGVFEANLTSTGLGSLAAGSYTIYLKVGETLWWPWNPY